MPVVVCRSSPGGVVGNHRLLVLLMGLKAKVLLALQVTQPVPNAGAAPVVLLKLNHFPPARRLGGLTDHQPAKVKWFARRRQLVVVWHGPMVKVFKVLLLRL